METSTDNEEFQLEHQGMQYLRRFFQIIFPLLAVSLTLSLILFPGEQQVARAQSGPCDKPFIPVATPLTDLGTNQYVRMDGQATNFSGGLYPDGSNEPPAEHASAGLAAAAQILPVDKDGNPNPETGKIGMVAIGMSNTFQEFERFISFSKDDPQINPRIIMVNGAIPGQTAQYWVDPEALTWQELEFRLARSKLTAPQVQVAWVKLTLTGGGKFPTRTQELQADLETISHNLKSKFPNLQIAFFSSRTRSYTYWEGLSPEPLAFETGFAVKWLIEKQINKDPSLNFDPQRGPVTAPYLAWGPYLWADGIHPRADGLVWTVDDLVIDCTHPSKQGEEKVAAQLMTFFKSNQAAKSWFLAEPQTIPLQVTATSALTLSPTPPPTAAPSPSPVPSKTMVMAAADTPTSSPGQSLQEVVQPTARFSTPSPLPSEVSNLSPSTPSLPIWGFAALGGSLIIVGGVVGLLFRRKQDRGNND